MEDVPSVSHRRLAVINLQKAFQRTFNQMVFVSPSFSSSKRIRILRHLKRKVYCEFTSCKSLHQLLNSNDKLAPSPSL